MPWRIDGAWHRVQRQDPRARALADRHYSRQTPGAADFMASGRVLVLLTDCGRAVWGAIESREPGSDRLTWRCSIFRNESPALSSDLIREATARTVVYWRAHYGAAPPVRLTTEVDPARTGRPGDNPGWCFLCAGWERLRVTNGAAKGRADLVILGAPLHREAVEATWVHALVALLRPWPARPTGSVDHA